MPTLTFKNLGTRVATRLVCLNVDPKAFPHTVRRRITPRAVRWAYRLLLDRDPESVRSVAEKVENCRDYHDLREIIFRSGEFRSKNPFTRVPDLTGDEPALEIEDDVEPAVMSKLIERIGRTWQHLGETEPHWSVISSTRFQSDNIKETQAEFFASGEEPASRLFKTLERNAIDPKPLRTCLEYGCGLGRVTGWLAERFDRVYAYDISLAHLQGAETQLLARGIENVSLRHIRGIDEIRKLERVDLVYSIMVLQHNPPPVIRLIVREFLRALNPGGVAYFQVPTYMAGYGFSAEAYLAEEDDAQEMEMHPFPQRVVFALAREEGCEPIEVFEDGWTGYRPQELSNTFVIRKAR